MVRAVTVTFNYDDEKEVVTDVKCHVEGQVKRKTRTTTKKALDLSESLPLVVREDTRLVFNDKILGIMNVEAGDRIDIKYEKDGDELFPVITPDNKGNKLAKANTIAFRGKKNEVLAEFGTEFTLEEYKEDMWKLVHSDGSTSSKTVEEKIEEAEQVEPKVIVDEDDTTEIDEITFSL